MDEQHVIKVTNECLFLLTDPSKCDKGGALMLSKGERTESVSQRRENLWETWGWMNERWTSAFPCVYKHVSFPHPTDRQRAETGATVVAGGVTTVKEEHKIWNKADVVFLRLWAPGRLHFRFLLLIKVMSQCCWNMECLNTSTSVITSNTQQKVTQTANRSRFPCSSRTEASGPDAVNTNLHPVKQAWAFLCYQPTPSLTEKEATSGWRGGSRWNVWPPEENVFTQNLKTNQ